MLVGKAGAVIANDEFGVRFGGEEYFNGRGGFASGNMRVSGRVRGYVNGVIDAEIKGTLNGTLKASVTSGTTIEPTKPDFYLPESKEQAAAEWAENYTEGEEV